ncbi:hypothetical protein SH501x_003197 [Pirellulaceae bacterium SH501]
MLSFCDENFTCNWLSYSISGFIAEGVVPYVDLTSETPQVLVHFPDNEVSTSRWTQITRQEPGRNNFDNDTPAWDLDYTASFDVIGRSRFYDVKYLRACGNIDRKLWTLLPPDYLSDDEKALVRSAVEPAMVRYNGIVKADHQAIDLNIAAFTLAPALLEWNRQFARESTFSRPLALAAVTKYLASFSTSELMRNESWFNAPDWRSIFSEIGVHGLQFNEENDSVSIGNLSKEAQAAVRLLLPPRRIRVRTDFTLDQSPLDSEVELLA